MLTAASCSCTSMSISLPVSTKYMHYLATGTKRTIPQQSYNIYKTKDCIHATYCNSTALALYPLLMYVTAHVIITSNSCVDRGPPPPHIFVDFPFTHSQQLIACLICYCKLNCMSMEFIIDLHRRGQRTYQLPSPAVADGSCHGFVRPYQLLIPLSPTQQLHVTVTLLS